jgi:hypothetical protein
VGRLARPGSASVYKYVRFLFREGQACRLCPLQPRTFCMLLLTPRHRTAAVTALKPHTHSKRLAVRGLQTRVVITAFG